MQEYNSNKEERMVLETENACYLENIKLWSRLVNVFKNLLIVEEMMVEIMWVPELGPEEIVLVLVEIQMNMVLGTGAKVVPCKIR